MCFVFCERVKCNVNDDPVTFFFFCVQFASFGQIIERKISELKPYANNPRLNDGAVDAVAASIKNFGFKVPLVVTADGEIIAGHTRLKAAQKLKMKTVPVIIADDLTPEQVRAFRLILLRLAEV